MAGRGSGMAAGAISAGLAAVVAFLSGHDGGGAVQPPVDPRRRADGDPAPEKGAERLGDLLGRALRTLGAQGEGMRDRAEGFYGMYRLLRALGMSDQEIAALIARQARAALERELRGRAPTAEETRRLLDSVQETVVRAAETVDERLDLSGDFVRRVREGAQATRPGREDAIIAVERGVAAAREQVRKILNDED